MQIRYMPTLTLLVLGVCVLLSLAGTAQASGHPKFRKSLQNSIPNHYILEFGNRDGATKFNAKHFFLRSVRKKFKRSSVVLKHDFAHELFNGVSLDVTGLNDNEHRALLKNIGANVDIVSVHPVARVSRPVVTLKKQEEEELPLNISALLPHTMTQVDRVHNELKNRGKGIVVGVVDSGVDYKHPALGGGFGPGYKVAYGADLVGDNFNSNNDDPIVKPNPTPYSNCGEGHGTHVSGIIAGNDSKTNFVGVAPEATLGMWRVFGCEGSTSDDLIAKGILMAYDSGSDIISLSLGEVNGWGDTLSSLVAERVAQRGVHVIVAAGNSGQYGAFTVGDPSTVKDAVSVASFNNMNTVSKGFITSGSINATIAYQPSNSSGHSFPTVEIAAGDKSIGGASDACSPSSVPDNLKGKLALVQRGTCTFDVKYRNVAKAGAVGLIVYNSASGDQFTPASSLKNAMIVGISNQDGASLVNALKAGKVSVNSATPNAIVPFGSGAGKVSDFSSVGPSYTLDLKPNIAGVGGSIYSTLPLAIGGWGIMSGTSMATPYVSGALALYLNSLGDKKNKTSTTFGLEQFQNHALVTSPLAGNSKDIDNPISQGAGLVQVYDAIKETFHVSPGQLSFNDTSARNANYKKQVLTVSNMGQSQITLQLANDASVSVVTYNLTDGYQMLQPNSTMTTDAAKLDFSKDSITLAPGQSDTITVTVTPPTTDPKLHVIYGGYVHFKSSDANTKDTRVPYFGIVGDQTQLPIFSKDSPFISDISGERVYQKNETFVLDRKEKKKSLVAIVSQLVSPTAKIVPEVLDKDGNVLGFMSTPMESHARNMPGDESDNNEITPFIWDGTYVPIYVGDTTTAVPVNDGTYHLRLRALKWLGDAGNGNDYEIWESGPIVVKN